MVRFAINQGTDNQPSWRVCDNARASKANAATRLLNTSTQMPLDHAVSCVRRMFQYAARDGWLDLFQPCVTTSDEKGAYRNCPPREVHLTPYLLVNPATGEISVWLPRGTNFGFSSAVLNYSRKPKLMCTFLALVLAVAIDHYIDDTAAVEIEAFLPKRVEGPIGRQLPGSAQDATHRIAALVGHVMNHEKEQEGDFSRCPTSCGIQTDLSQVSSHHKAYMQVKPSTREKATAMIQRAIRDQCLYPSEAASLVGKARFVFSFTQAGRQALQPLRDRQYCSQGRIDLSEDLHDALQYLFSLFSHCSLRLETRLTPAEKPPVLIWTDGSFQPSQPPIFGYGEVGFVILYRDSWYSRPLIYFGSLIINNDWFHAVHALRRQTNFIMPIEAAGIGAPYFSQELNNILGRQDIIAFGDNQACNGAAIKGYSRAADVGHIITNTHVRLQQMESRFWLEDIRSHSNIGDDPSRGALDRLYGLAQVFQTSVTQVQLTLPPLTAWQSDYNTYIPGTKSASNSNPGQTDSS